ncbi:TetR/AcrR family transcriptional regulator [Halomonas salipaludis]|uniref:HTH tetR-type domain-containing protein n=1 Tax=Halomonas salipaludis TaxID=2032625 RepID=A0A2A2EY82_9GAMM|nr:TetR/AcrR family transcriptional regulator [Halomonas salipaludis]PAU77253.1 hypothetical protein CK498_08390 [Halomonas salipaludis]
MEKTLKTKRRGRGRPRLDGGNGEGIVSREAVIDLAYELARSEPLEDVSFVRLAKVLGVVPGALHYHIGTKDDLTSAILNRFYKQLLARLRKIPEDLPWRERLRQFACILMASERDHRGAAEYIQTKARFRVFQKVRAGETDYGAAYLDHVFSLFREAGFDAEQSAMFYHVLALHCLAAANSHVARLEPAEHEHFLLKQASTFSAGTMPGLDFAIKAFSGIRADDAFEFGLEALLDRFAAARGCEPKQAVHDGVS